MAAIENATRRLSLADYDAMIRDGQFRGDERLELLDGLLVKKKTKGFRHVAITHRLFLSLIRSLPGEWHARKEDPVDLPGGPIEGAPSRPEPDVAVVKGPEGCFDNGYPSAGDLVLVVEVASDSRSLALDREGLARYAWNRVAVVWIVNLAASVIEVYSDPTGPVEFPVYEQNAVKRAGDSIVVRLDGEREITLDVAALLA